MVPGSDFSLPPLLQKGLHCLPKVEEVAVIEESPNSLQCVVLHGVPPTCIEWEWVRSLQHLRKVEVSFIGADSGVGESVRARAGASAGEDAQEVSVERNNGILRARTGTKVGAGDGVRAETEAERGNDGDNASEDAYAGMGAGAGQGAGTETGADDSASVSVRAESEAEVDSDGVNASGDVCASMDAGAGQGVDAEAGVDESPVGRKIGEHACPREDASADAGAQTGPRVNSGTGEDTGAFAGVNTRPASASANARAVAKTLSDHICFDNENASISCISTEAVLSVVGNIHGNILQKVHVQYFSTVVFHYFTIMIYFPWHWVLKSHIFAHARSINHDYNKKYIIIRVLILMFYWSIHISI